MQFNLNFTTIFIITSYVNLELCKKYLSAKFLTFQNPEVQDFLDLKPKVQSLDFFEFLPKVLQ